ncbi:MAG TPA: hypothetical protein VFM18_22675 [Methanosarcina sp.]|nr:hypothetical protein [Methanosarcina sp.]
MSNTQFSKGVQDPTSYSDAATVNTAPDGSFQPSSSIYIPSGTGFFEKLLSVNGAVLNGITDDSAAFQAALNSIPSGRIKECMIPRGVNSIKINSGLTIDASKTYLDFGGCLLDASGMTSGTAITINGSGTQSGDTSYGQQMSGINRMQLEGPGRYNGVDGILLTGGTSASPAIGSARTAIQNSKIHNFQKGITFYNRAYLSTFFNCEIGSHLIGIYSKGGGYDAYENVGFSRCTIGNSDINIYVEDGIINLSQCSVDYAEFVQMAIRAGILSLIDCHVEFSIKSGQYGIASNTNNAIYSGIAPLCAIDMAPGQSVALRSDLGLTSTTPSGLQNFALFRMIGGLFAPTAARSGATNAYKVIVNTVGNAQSYFGGKIRMSQGQNCPSSGYFAHTLSNYNTTGTYSGNFNWEPGSYFNSSDDFPNLMFETPSHLTGTLDHGYSIAPNMNMAGSGSFGNYQASGLQGFESSAGIMEDLTILDDSNGSTTVTIPANKLTGIAGSAALDSTFSNAGSKSLKFMKNSTALATYPLKFAFTYHTRPNTQSRPLIRFAVGKPATGYPATGSFNVAIKYIKPEMKVLSSGEIRLQPTNGATYLAGTTLASSADAQAIHCTTGVKGKTASLYVDVSTIPVGGWIYCQLNTDPDFSYQPGWASHFQLEFDFKNMDPGQINLDQLDIQYV